MVFHRVGGGCGAGLASASQIVRSCLFHFTIKGGEYRGCGSERNQNPFILSFLVNLCLLVAANQTQELIVTERSDALSKDCG